MNPRLIAAVLLPFVACGLQWVLWGTLKPYVWFLFFPAAFFSAWLGGLRGGLAGTIIARGERSKGATFCFTLPSNASHPTSHSPLP
jgi:hypothetical protein